MRNEMAKALQRFTRQAGSDASLEKPCTLKVQLEAAHQAAHQTGRSQPVATAQPTATLVPSVAPAPATATAATQPAAAAARPAVAVAQRGGGG